MTTEWVTYGDRKLTEAQKETFLQSISDTAELLDVNLTVEHLLPALTNILEQ